MSETHTAPGHSNAPREHRRVTYLRPQALHALMDSTHPPVILDVRREEGFAMQPFQIPGALRYSLDARRKACPRCLGRPRSWPIAPDRATPRAPG